MAIAGSLSAHSVHLVIFGVPVLVLCAAVAWQELRARIAGRTRREPDAHHGRPVTESGPAEWCWLATGGLVAAGGIHAAVAPEHFRESLAFGVFFAVLTAAQWVAAWLWLRRPTLRAAHLIAWGSASVVILWVASRTAGLPVGPEPWRPERLSQADLLATCFELMTCVACLIQASGLRRAPLRPSYEGAR
jgi:hypothetical protein